TRERFPRSNNLATIGLPSDDAHHRPKLSSDSTVRSCRAGRTALDWASGLGPKALLAQTRKMAATYLIVAGSVSGDLGF
ncbi:MAG TPA: hypothetical protein VFJ93_09860, partial [Gaiellaceae bacterium]|nr:hypothetical protein [Gaiellaceae bacterium]